MGEKKKKERKKWETERENYSRECWFRLLNYKLATLVRTEFTLRLPRAQYSTTMHMLGGSVHAPMKAFKLSCRKSRI